MKRTYSIHDRNLHAKTRDAKKDRKGAVLIVVLVLVMLMSVSAYGFLLSMQTENLVARSSGDQILKQHAAFSGRELFASLVALPGQKRAELGGIENNPARFGSESSDIGKERDQDQVPQFVVIAPSFDSRQSHRGENSRTNLRTEETSPQYGGINESAKLNLRSLVAWDRFQPDAGRQALMRLPGMTISIADSLLDWVDEDSQPRSEGAETDAYNRLGVTYSPRNGIPLDLDELLLVKGMSRELLFDAMNSDFNRASSNSPNGFSNQQSKDVPWCHYLSVYSAERNHARDGNPRINVNGPDLASLHQKLTERVSVELASFIILFRQNSQGSSGTSPMPVNSPSSETMSASAITNSTSAGSSVESIEPSQVPMDFSRPPVRNIESLIDLIGATITVNQNGKSVQVKSPFTKEIQQLDPLLSDTVDRLTTVGSPRLEGRVNINLASREVLLGIPGLDEGLVERIVGARTMAGIENSNRNSPTWLLTEGIVDVPMMRRLLPLVTTGGDVYRAEFWGFIDNASPAYRCEAVLDASGPEVRQVYFRELEPDLISFLGESKESE